MNQNPTARRWLEALPGLIDTMLSAWRLSPTAPPSFGGTSLVIPVLDAERRRAALKLVSPVADAGLEARALGVLGGAGAVQLYEFDGESQVLLLESLEMPAQTMRPEPVRMAEICGALAARIVSVSAPEDAPTMSGDAGQWRAEFADQHARALVDGRALPEEVYRRADELIAELEIIRSTTMTHGDLSFDNIGLRADGSWVSCDPKYLSGPGENEAHTIVRSMPRLRVDGRDHASSSRLLLDAFCDAGGFDRALAQRLSNTRFAASYYWDSEHGGSPRSVEWLRIMAGEG